MTPSTMLCDAARNTLLDADQMLALGSHTAWYPGAYQVCLNTIHRTISGSWL